MPNTVYVLLTGDGSDGNEYSIVAIYATLELAKYALDEYKKPVTNSRGREYIRDAEIEAWVVRDA